MVEVSEVSDMARAYIACALWTSTDDSEEGGGEPLDSVYSIDDLPQETLAIMVTEADSFYAAHAELLATCGASAEQIGHDYWLTRNGHGAGFWDRGDEHYPKHARDLLSEMARLDGSRDLYCGDDGLIYQSGH